MIPATQIAMRFNLPFTDLHSFLNNNGRFYPSREGQQYSDRTNAKGILLVDDSVWSGNSIKTAIQEIAIHPLLNALPLQVFAIYGNPNSNEVLSQLMLGSPRIFEWNWTRNAYLQETMLDLDGIFCDDPNPARTRERDYYDEWVSNPVPKHLTTQRVRAIISARLEEYRPQTESWLARYKIEYQELQLLDCTEEERHYGNLHAEHKVKWFSNSNSSLFIESDLTQAQYINRRVGKAVFCPASSNKPSIFFREKSYR